MTRPRHLPYPGGVDQKRLSRGLTFLKVKKIWDSSGRPTGKFLTLTGHGEDMRIFRDFLRVPARDAYFIDNKERVGLDKVKSKWPRANTIFRDVTKILKEFEEPVALIYLDFMGHYSDKVAKTLDALRELVPVHGVVIYNFLRGQESVCNSHWPRLKEKMRDRMSRYLEEFPTLRVDQNDSIRFWGYEDLLREHLGDDYACVYTTKYSRVSEGLTSTGPSFGTIAMQRMPSYARTTKWMNTVEQATFEEDRTGKVESIGVSQRIRFVIEALSKDGYSGSQISGLLDFPSRTIAAYRAVLTKRA